jgi:uncharacterized protein GlcG (DUF336 family)
MNGFDPKALDGLATQVARAVEAEFAPLTLDRARALSQRVEAEAARLGVLASIAICDAGGHLVLFERLGGGFFGAIDIAIQKAKTAAALRRSTRELGAQAQPGAALYGIQWTNGGQLVIIGGGEPLLRGRFLCGGLGVSGGSLEDDTALAAFGARVWREV